MLLPPAQSPAVMIHLAQRGFSLIELVMVLALSSLLILGMTQLYMDSGRLYQQQQVASRDLDTARFTLQSLDSILRRAGYRQNPLLPAGQDFPAHGVGDCHFSAGEFIRRIAADVLCLRYQARSPQERDCEGNLVAGTAGSIPGRIERLQYDSANASLYCRAVASDAALTGKGAALVEGIGSVHFDIAEITRFDHETHAFIRYSVLLNTHRQVFPGLQRALEFWCREWSVPAHGRCNGGEKGAEGTMFFSRLVAIRRLES